MDAYTYLTDLLNSLALSDKVYKILLNNIEALLNMEYMKGYDQGYQDAKSIDREL